MPELSAGNRISISVSNLRLAYPSNKVTDGRVTASILDAATGVEVMPEETVDYTGIPGRFEGTFSVNLVDGSEYKVVIRYYEPAGNLAATWVKYVQSGERAATIGA
jgi:hypothetical protein